MLTAMLGGRVTALVMLAMVVTHTHSSQTDNEEQRKGRQFQESSKDPFVVGISQELSK